MNTLEILYTAEHPISARRLFSTKKVITDRIDRRAVCDKVVIASITSEGTSSHSALTRSMAIMQGSWTIAAGTIHQCQNRRIIHKADHRPGHTLTLTANADRTCKGEVDTAPENSVASAVATMSAVGPRGTFDSDKTVITCVAHAVTKSGSSVACK